MMMAELVGMGPFLFPQLRVELDMRRPSKGRSAPWQIASFLRVDTQRGTTS